MPKLKSLLVLLFFATLSYSGFCQPIFTASASNLNQTVADIQQIYGNQIDLSSTAIENYLLPFVQNSQPNNGCPTPIPQIEHLGPGTITLSWPAISSAISYGAYYLNLNDGSSGSVTTSAPGFVFTGLTPGLYAIGVFADCGSALSLNGIIITDIDILMPGVPLPDCNCSITYPLELDPIDDNNYKYEWPEGLTERVFKLEVLGFDEEAELPETYYSSVTFTYDILEDEPVIYAHSNCDINALSSIEYPRHMGAKEEDNFYNLSFRNIDVILNFPETSFLRSEVVLKECILNREEERKNEGTPTTEFSQNHFEIYPNPSEQQTTISYQLSKDSEVQIIVYDLLGKVVKEIIPLSTQSKGIHQLPVDISSWSQGIYTVQFLSVDFKKTLMLKKVE